MKTRNNVLSRKMFWYLSYALTTAT